MFAENDKGAIGSAKAALELVQKGVDIVLLPIFSNEAEAAADVLAASNVPFITSATSHMIIKPGYSGLSTAPSNLAQALMLVGYINEHYRGRPITVISNPSLRYSNEMTEFFINAMKDESPETSIQTRSIGIYDMFASINTDLNNSLIFAPLYNPNISVLYHHLAEQTYEDVIVFGPDSVGARKGFFSTIGQSNDQIQLLTLKSWDKKVDGRNITPIKSYVDTYCHGGELTGEMVMAYDLIRVVMKSVDKLFMAKTAEGAINIIRSSSYRAIADGQVMTFDDIGFRRKEMHLSQIEGKGLKYIESLRGDVVWKD